MLWQWVVANKIGEAKATGGHLRWARLRTTTTTGEAGDGDDTVVREGLEWG